MNLQAGSDNMVKIYKDAQVEIFHDASVKLATTSTGIDVTGNVTMATGGSIVAGGANDLILNAGESGTPDIYLQSGSSTKVKIEGSNGNVGIGTSNPDTSLHVTTPSGTKTELNLAQTAVTNYRLSIPASTDALTFVYGANTERMRIDSSGNALVGRTSSLSGQSGSVSANTVLSTHGPLSAHATNAGILEYYNDETLLRSYGANAGSGKLVFKVGGGGGSADSEAMRIESSGNVGINTSSPAATLHTVANSGTTGFLLTGAASNNIASFYTSGGSQAMTLDSSGNVGIGVSSPDAPLSFGAYIPSDGQTIHTYQSGNVRSGLGIVTGAHRMFTNSSSVLSFGQVSESDGSTYTERMRISSAGSLMVNSTTNFGKFVVENGGNSYPSWFRNTSSSIDYPNRIMSNYATGGQTATMLQFLNASSAAVGAIKSTASATSYVTSSDQRLKENIADADDAGSKVDAIQVRKFDWKADGSHQDYGMIAQELQAVAPEAVSGDADSEEMMGVDYSKLVPMLIKEIQSLRNRVAQLEE